MNLIDIETIKLSLVFFILFTSFSSYMTILTHIYEEQGLNGIGPATLATNYTAFIFSSFLAPACKWKLKTQILIGTIAYTFNYSTGILVPFVDEPVLKYMITCFGSGTAGLSAGFLWVSQGAYLHLLCKQNNVPQEQKGRYFGLFSSLYCLSNISAGIITTFGLGFFNNEIYFIIITVIGIFSCLFCWFCLKDIQPNQSYKNENILGQDYNITESLKSMIGFIPKMVSVIPILFIDGIALGIYSSEITHLMPSLLPTDDKNLWAGVATISLGIGSVIGGRLSGHFADQLKGVRAAQIGLAQYFIGCLTCILAIYVNQYFMTLIAAFIWGFGLFYIEGWMYLACSRYFGGKPQAFSMNKLMHSIFYLIFQIIILLTNNNLNLYILFGSITVLTIPALFLLQRLPTMSKNIEHAAMEESIISQTSDII